VSFIYDFEESVVRSVRERGLDGAICGHIHAASIKQVDGSIYINCGDWVDSCTAIVEHMDGRMELIHWTGLAHAPGEDDEELMPAVLAGDVLASREVCERETV